MCMKFRAFQKKEGCRTRIIFEIIYAERRQYLNV